MSNLFDALGFSLSSLADFEDAALARRVVERLLSLPAGLAPVRYSAFEPVNRPIERSDPEAPVRLWLNSEANVRNRERLGQVAGSLMLESGKSAEYHIDWQKTSVPSFASITGNAPISLVREDPAAQAGFLSLVRDLVGVTSSVYGEIRNMSFRGWDTPLDLAKRLPDIPWVSIYGAPYIDFFGKERILSAPWNFVQEFGSGHLWLQATASPFDPVPEEISGRIRQHLGEDAFMSGGRWRYNDGRAPRFEFDRVLLR